MTESEIYLRQYADFLEGILKEAERIIEDVSNDGSSPYSTDAQDFLMDFDNKRRNFNMRNTFNKFRR